MGAIALHGLDLEALMSAHQAAVWGYLRYLGCQRPEADELTQETFVSVLERPFEERGTGETRAYLRERARMIFLNHRRKSVRDARARETLAGDLESAEQVWAADVPEGDFNRYVAALRDCTGRLDEKPRQALHLRYAERMALDAAAEHLGMKLAGLKTLLLRTRETLRQCIERRLGQ